MSGILLWSSVIVYWIHRSTNLFRPIQILKIIHLKLALKHLHTKNIHLYLSSLIILYYGKILLVFWLRSNNRISPSLLLQELRRKFTLHPSFQIDINFSQQINNGKAIFISYGTVVRDFESEAKTRCNFQFR